MVPWNLTLHRRHLNHVLACVNVIKWIVRNALIKQIFVSDHLWIFCLQSCQTNAGTLYAQSAKLPLALAIPPKLGHPWQRGAGGGGAPLARLFCISNNFNNHEHKREEDTLKWVKKNLLVIYSCTYNFCQSYCVTLYILHDFFLFWCATQILLVVPIWPHL